MSTSDSDDDIYVGGYAGNDQLDTGEALTGDDTQDPLDPGYTTPDREPKRWMGDTEQETQQGESLDQHLAEEEPDVSVDDIAAADEQPRAGRLVAPDEGGLFHEKKDEVAEDVGRAGYAASAEEAAVHIDENG